MTEKNKRKYGWEVKESQYKDVSSGRKCPKCLGTNVKYVGCNPDGINMNRAFDCKDCKYQWEGA